MSIRRVVNSAVPVAGGINLWACLVLACNLQLEVFKTLRFLKAFINLN